MIVRIATRGSKLALAQAREVAEALRSLRIESEFVIVRTKGDRHRDRPVKELGPRIFEREVNLTLLEGKADLAVHSMKDVPTVVHEDLVLAAVLPRASPLDVLVSRVPLDRLLEGAKIGTGSPRRRGALLRLYPNLRFSDIRGNVDTRLEKLRRGECDGIMVAKAALERLGLDCVGFHCKTFLPDEVVPAAGQGAIAVFATKDSPYLSVLRKMNHERSYLEVSLERSILRELGAGCSTPLGVHSKIVGSEVRVLVGLYESDPVILDRRYDVSDLRSIPRDIVSQLKR